MHFTRFFVRIGFALLLLPVAHPFAGPPERLTLYVALDRQYSAPLIERYVSETGASVDVRHDSETNKTVGLVKAIREESKAPRGDVFWNNELAHTVRLAQEGLLTPYHSPAARPIPDSFKDPEGRWTGFAARARVLIINPALCGTDRTGWPRSIQDFSDPKWRGRCAIARPLTGTTLTHFAALHQVMGSPRFGVWLDALEANEVRWLRSNGATMRQTADPGGGIAFALTDTDDVHAALLTGARVHCVFPDQEPGGLGTLLIPNSVAIIAGGPNPGAARRFVDWLLSDRIEALLATGASAQIPLRPGVPGPVSVEILSLDKFRPMAWNPSGVAAMLEDRLQEFSTRFPMDR